MLAEGLWRADIDRHTQRFLQLRTEQEQLEWTYARLELHDEVEVTGSVVVATCDGAEQGDGPTVMARRYGLDLLAAGLNQLPQRRPADIGYAYIPGASATRTGGSPPELI